MKQQENAPLLLGVLGKDVSTAFKELEHDTQFNRRTCFRTFFAFVEGAVFILKRNVLLLHEKGIAHFSQAELALLHEEQYDLNKKGEVKTPRPKFLRLPDNVLFSCKVYAKAYQLSYKLDVSGEGWGSFRKALAVRNRIMHPKHSNDLEIKDEEMKDIDKAFEWYTKTMGELIKETIMSLES